MHLDSASSGPAAGGRDRLDAAPVAISLSEAPVAFPTVTKDRHEVFAPHMGDTDRRRWPYKSIWRDPLRRREPKAVARPPFRGPLRVATFNVGMMSTFIDKWDRDKDKFGAITEGIVNLFMTDEDAVALGDQLANRLLAAPYDIVVLNELFHADARAQVRRRLTDPNLADGVRYPWVRHGFGAEERTPPGNPQPMPWDVTPDWGLFPDIDGNAIGALRSLLDDSGLFIASRLKLEDFILEGRTTDWAFCRYSSAAGIDAACPKGAAAVVVRPPDRRNLVVAFTHMQADYGADDSHPHVRRDQIEQLMWLARGVGDAASSTDVLVMGDLNIRGEVPASDAGAHSPEWMDAFGPAGQLSQFGPDGWLDGACGPADSAGVPAPGHFDPQPTHPGGLDATGDEERLDYIVAGHLAPRGASDRTIGVQHLMIGTNLHDGLIFPETPIGLSPVDLTAPRGMAPLSDHFGVNAIVGDHREASSPRSAINCTPVLGSGSSSAQESRSFDNVGHGNLRWVWLEPGAYRIVVSQNIGHPIPPVDLEVYDPTDLSASLVDVMPPAPTPVDLREGIRFPAVNHPLLVRFHGRVKTVNEIGITVRLILGATPDDAVPLSPWMPTAAMAWPTPQQGGDADRARWFEVLLKNPDPGTEQTIELIAVDAAGATLPVRFETFPKTSIQTPAADLQTPHVVLSPGEEHVVTGTADSHRRFLVRALPDVSVQDVETVVEVRSDLCFLEGAGFIALDETGADWSGADEISWSVKSDLQTVALTGSEDDVDTGESYAMVGRVAFREHVHVAITEDGGLAGDEKASFSLPGGTPADQLDMHRATLPDDVKDGEYGLVFSWTRTLRNAD